jgi:hypothetical protein
MSTIPSDALNALREKSAQSSAPAPAAAPAAAPQSQAQPDSAQPDSNVPEDDDAEATGAAKGGTVNLHNAFANLQRKLTAVADSTGTRRSFTVRQSKGDSAADHIQAVGDQAAQTGGLSANLLTHAHDENSKYGEGNSQTVAWPASKLLEQIIPKDSVAAGEAIQAAKSYITKLKSLTGSDPSIDKGLATISLIGKTGAAGMSVSDFFIALQNICVAPTQLLARQHSAVKHSDIGGIHPSLTAPSTSDQHRQSHPAKTEASS